MRKATLTTTKVIRRIRKLIALSESPNEAEAASALAKAKILLAKHNVSLTEINDRETDVKELHLPVENNLHPWEEKLLACITKPTFTSAIKLYVDGILYIKLIGKEANAISAKVLYEYLHEAVVTRAKMFSAAIDDLESFRIGMVDSIRKKLEEEISRTPRRVGTKELMLNVEKESAECISKYLREAYGETESSENWYGVDPNSYGLGKAIGKKISVSEQIAVQKKSN
jgi:hypothetical protein